MRLAGERPASLFGIRLCDSLRIASPASFGTIMRRAPRAQGLERMQKVREAAVAGGSGSDSSAERDRAVAEMAKFSGPYEYPFGTTRVSDYAIVAMRHMHEYGTTAAQLAEVAVAERRSATLHPLSVYGERGEITIADVLNSRLIAEPLRLLDCCGINQGGGAVLVTSEADVRAAGG